jgi:hypothetical protein
LTVPEISEGVTVCVTVTVGSGDGEAVEAGSDVVVSVGVGDGSTIGKSFDGLCEVGPSVTTVTPLALKVPDDVAQESPGKAEGEKGGIHYRPQFMTRAIPMLTSETMPTPATIRASADCGGSTDISWCDDIRCVQPCH